MNITQDHLKIAVEEINKYLQFLLETEDGADMIDTAEQAIKAGNFSEITEEVQAVNVLINTIAGVIKDEFYIDSIEDA